MLEIWDLCLAITFDVGKTYIGRVIRGERRCG